MTVGCSLKVPKAKISGMTVGCFLKVPKAEISGRVCGALKESTFVDVSHFRHMPRAVEIHQDSPTPET
jgi:hypothetical protein